MDTPISRTVLREAAGMLFLLELEIAGKKLRFASRPLEIEGIRFLGGLPSLEIEESLDLLGQTPQIPSLSFALNVSEPIAALVSEGHRLDFGTVELSLWAIGTEYAARNTVVAGRVLFGAYGGEGEPLVLTVEAQKTGEGRQIFGDANYRKGSVVANRFVESSTGKPYPVVLGQPYALRRSDFTPGPAEIEDSAYASEGLPYLHDLGFTDLISEIVISAGHCPVSENVVIRWEGCPAPADDGEMSVSWGFINLTADRFGVPLTTVSLAALNTAGLITANQRRAAKWFVKWRSAAGGGVTGRSGGISQIYRVFLGTSSPVDTVIADLRQGDVITEAWYNVVTPSLAVTRNLAITAEPRLAGPLTLIAASGPELSTTGKVFSPTVPARMAGNYPVRAVFQASAATVVRVGLRVRRVPLPGSGIASLGELAAYLAARSGVPSPAAEWDALAPLLDLPAAGTFEGEAGAWDILTTEILPIAPISLRAGAKGVYPVLWRWWATEGDAVAHFVAGRAGIVRLPDVRAARADSEVNTLFTLQYGYDAQRGAFRNRATLGPEAPTIGIVGGNFQMGAPRSATLDNQLSYQRFGERALALESRVIYAAETALWALRWRAASEGWAHRVLEIEGPHDLAGISLGDIVTFTDTTISLNSAVALVSGRTLRDTGRVGLTLVLVEGASRVPISPYLPTAGAFPRPGGPIPGQF
jgi:hypothetical protein